MVTWVKGLVGARTSQLHRCRGVAQAFVQCRRRSYLHPYSAAAATAPTHQAFFYVDVYTIEFNPLVVDCYNLESV